ncbi:MAG: hypothetical protein D6802_03810 [Ardenticatenia bacterium]|nr:MAG: hypothetical protein D6802_03810 [Ardenticatenia bacterium]
MRRIRRLVLVFALIGVLATGWALVTMRPRLSTFLRHQTGEEDWRAQVRGVGHLLSGMLRPQPDAAPYEPVAHAGLYPFGVNTFLQTEADPGRVERTLQMIEDAGFRWIRQEFPWEDLEIHRKGWFVDLRNHEIRNAWRKYDYIVERAEAHNITIIARLSNPPAWSRAAGNEVGPQAPPDRLEDYCDYVQAVAARYKGRIRYYQIWNEPNIFPEWGTYAISPEQYARLLQTGYTCIKAVDPDAVVLTAPLAPTIELTQRDFNDFLFLQRLYDAGAAQWFDVLAVQDYGLWSGPYDRRMRPRVLNFSRPIYIRDIMRRNGDGQKAIWLSEMGWNSTPEGILPVFGRTPEELRARYAVEAFERVQREWPWTGVMTYWFFKQADESEKDQPQYYFRLVEPDFTPTAAYDAIKAYLTTLQPTLYRGYHQENHWALTYNGEWHTVNDARAVLGAYRRGEAGATLAFGVEARRVLLMVRPETQATLEIRLDNGEPRRIDVQPASADPLPILLADDLDEGRHTLHISVVNGQLKVDGVLVYAP